MNDKKLVRAALGNIAALGDLYDARTDNFLKISIFNKKIPADATNLTDSHFSDIHLIHSDTYSEKFSKLDVQGELKVSVLAGLFNPEGSGRYLSDNKTSARAVKSSLLYNIKTIEESVNIYHQELKNIFALEAVESGLATHVVVGISWGANSILSCKYLNTENQDVTEIKGKMSTQMKKIGMSISGNGSVDFKEGDNNKDLDLEIHVYGDILPNNEDLPTSISEALTFMKQMPSLIAKSNQGRGKPITYYLLPLSVLQNYFKFSLKVNLMNKSLEEDVMLKVVNIFENITSAHQELQDFYQDSMTHTFCVKKEDMELVAKIKEGFDIQEIKFRSDLCSTLTALRSGKGEASDVENLLTKYISGDFSPNKVFEKLKHLNYISENIAFADLLISSGAKYLGYGSSLENIIFDNHKAYVLYFNDESKTSQVETWKKNRQLFYHEMKKRKEGRIFLAVDCDIHPKLWPKMGMSIQVLENGQVVIENMLNDLEVISNTAHARCTLKMTRIIAKPNNRVHLVIPCTGKYCKSDIAYEWMCPKCKNQVEYGFDDKMYCSCGYGDASYYEFKCIDNKHGVDYDCHEDTNYFKELLFQLRPHKEMNILLLGETGVGKSTWINGFQNYLNYSSLDEAEENELYSLIPSQFTVCDENYEDIIVSTGTDKNEIHATGQSATQESKVYAFVVGDTKIRLIDTPGVGDTRGIDQDKINFENILVTLSYLDELHGICILLKPNNSRINVMFEFCIKELLTFLHRDASKNIMFCFTNSRGTFYRPGDTMPLLKKLISSNKGVTIPISYNTVYCFDSEAYRFLAAVKNKTKPVKFSDDDHKNFAESWQKSVTETKRMIQHITQLIPHPIKNTLSLNAARNLVQKLTRPMAEISKNIQTNREVLKDRINEIKETEANIKNLEKEKTFKKVELEVIPIDYPKTVCTNIDCKKIIRRGEFIQVNYTTVCHDHCQLKNVDHDTVGDARLLSCSAIKGGICKHCRHNYKEHMHIYYVSNEVEKEFVDPEVVKMLNSELSEAEKKQRLIYFKENEIIELNKELKIIEDSSVKFAYFLKHNAITPYNDAMLKYLNHLIREETDKVNNGGSDKTLKSLEIYKSSYTKNIEILSKEMEKGDVFGDIMIPEISSLVDSLCKLKHSGNHLQTCLNVESSTQKETAIYQEVFAAKSVKENRSRLRKLADWFIVKLT